VRTRFRVAGPDDLPAIQVVEVAAGTLFRDLGMDATADHEPPDAEVLSDYISGGRCWVGVDPDDGPIAYILVDVVDGAAHIEQVSVRPDHAHQRIGAALIDTVAGWAAEKLLTAVTLTTFAAVPWNGPYYRRLGFEPIEPDDLGIGLAARRQHEAERGLDRWPRFAMVRPV
jgi:GNAT superfamily N-acetyltransferase